MGKTHDAKDLVRQSNVGDIAPQATPGKSTLSNGPTGDPFSDHGAVCDGKMGNGCILTFTQRRDLIIQFKDRVRGAATNYNTALLAVRVDKMLEKPDSDMPWLVTLFLDLAVGHIATRFSKVVSQIKNTTVASDAAARANKLKNLDPHDIENIDLSSFDTPLWKQRLRDGFLQMDDEKIKGGIRDAAVGAKQSTLSSRQKSLENEHETQTTAVKDYTRQLADSASVGFARVSEHAPAFANDIELIALFQAMDPVNHMQSDYEEAIRSKIERFMKSGVAKIGIHSARRATMPEADGGTEDVHEPRYGSTEVKRHTRVVWQEYVSGYPRDLVFSHHDHSLEENVTGPMPVTIGSFPLTKEAELGQVVPREFHDAAVARHVAAWGGTPKTVLKDDSVYWWDIERMKQAKKHKQHQDAGFFAKFASAATKPPGPRSQVVQQQASQSRGFFLDFLSSDQSKPSQLQSVSDKVKDSSGKSDS